MPGSSTASAKSRLGTETWSRVGVRIRIRVRVRVRVRV